MQRPYAFCRLTSQSVVVLLYIFIYCINICSALRGPIVIRHSILKSQCYRKVGHQSNLQFKSNHDIRRVRKTELFESNRDENWSELAVDAIDLLKDAALPANGGELISIFVSEAFAGFVSGLSFRLVSFAIGDRNAARDTSILQGTTAGAYFGLRATVRNIAEILGIPRPIAAVIAGFTASILSEEIKLVGREIEDQIQETRKDVALQEIIESQDKLEFKEGSKKLSISIPELSQDLTKWVAYDLLMPQDGTVFSASVCGAASGLIAHSIYEILLPTTKAYFLRKEAFPPSEYLRIANRFLQAGLEAAALFTAYESTIIIFKYFIPPDLSRLLEENFGAFFTDIFNLFN